MQSQGQAREGAALEEEEPGHGPALTGLGKDTP